MLLSHINYCQASRVRGHTKVTCPVTTDLIMRVNVRTTTTATDSCRASSYKYHRSFFLGLDLDPIFLRCNYRIKYRYSSSHSVPASTLHGGHDGRCHP